MDKKTSLTSQQSPVISHGSNGHYTRIFKSVNHQSLAIQPLVIGQGKANIHWSTGHQPAVIRLYINLHLVRLMPWAWSSLIITQKEFYYPWNWTLVICLIPVLLSNHLTTTGDQTTDKLYRLPSLDIFPGWINLEVNISPRRGGDIDRPLHPPLLGPHLQTLAKETESQKDPNL